MAALDASHAPNFATVRSNQSSGLGGPNPALLSLLAISQEFLHLFPELGESTPFQFCFPDKCSTRQITVPTLGQHARSASPWRQAKVQVWIGRMRCWDGSFGTRNKPLPGFMRDRSPVMKRAGRCARCALCLFEVKICDSRVLHSWTRCLKPCRISDYYHVCKIKAASTRRDVKA